MSAKKRKDNDPVTEKLCKSRRETIAAEINGLKKTIYASSCAVALVVTIVEVLLRIYH